MSFTEEQGREMIRRTEANRGKKRVVIDPTTTDDSLLPQPVQEAVNAYHKRRNETHNQTSRAVVEPIVRNESMAATKGEDANSNRVRVCVTRFGRRLLDPDNVCPKYFIDCLRYAMLIPDDRAEDISLQVEQVKVKLKSDERTEITIE